MESYNLVPIFDASSKQIYQFFLRKKQIPPTAKQKLTNKYPNTVISWQKVYSLAFQTTLESKIREFQYKIWLTKIWLNHQVVLSLKRLRNPWSIYFSPVRYLQIFGNTSCPG